MKLRLSDPVSAIQQFGQDERGAALVEYTVLLGVLLVVVVTMILGVGTWISGQWSSLSSTI